MSPHQSRGTTAGRVFNDLRNMARREGRSTEELLVFICLGTVSAPGEPLALR
jgi:hypothetical protein